MEAARLYKLAADQGFAIALYHLGVMYSKGKGVAKSLKEAARLFRDSRGALAAIEENLAFRRRTLPPDHPFIASSLWNLAAIYREIGRHDDALVLQQETLAVQKRVLSPDHPHVAGAMDNLAVTYVHLGRHRDALVLRQETLAFQKRVLPADHPDIARSMTNLACVYCELGRHDDALVLCHETLALRKRVLPPDHPDIANSMDDLRDAQAAAAQRPASMQRSATTKSQLQAKLAQRRKAPKASEAAAAPAEDRSIDELLAFIGGDDNAPPASGLGLGPGSKTASKSKSKKGGKGKSKNQKKR